MSPIDAAIAEWAARLEQGAAEYGDQSFLRPVTQTVRELEQELADLPGWLYVLWCQAARKTDMVRDQKTLRGLYLEALRRRLHRNDRGRRDVIPAFGVLTCMDDIEVLAMDCYHFARQFRDRLSPIARAIEVSQALDRSAYRGRRGGERDPRSDD